MKYAGLALVSLFFVIGGQAHFTSTEFFVSIVPPYVPLPRLTVYVTGVLELIGAIAIWVPAIASDDAVNRRPGAASGLHLRGRRS